MHNGLIHIMTESFEGHAQETENQALSLLCELDLVEDP